MARMPVMTASDRQVTTSTAYGCGLRRRAVDRAPLADARRLLGRSLAFTRVEYPARVEGLAHGLLQGEGSRVELTAHPVPFQQPDAMLAGHRAAQRDRPVEKLLERGLGCGPRGRRRPPA